MRILSKCYSGRYHVASVLVATYALGGMSTILCLDTLADRCGNRWDVDFAVFSRCLPAQQLEGMADMRYISGTNETLFSCSEKVVSNPLNTETFMLIAWLHVMVFNRLAD